MMRIFVTVLLLAGVCTSARAQELMETGGQKMPNEWIDKDTHHKVVKLSAGLPGNSLSFYFHNSPFIGNEMIFYNNSKQKAADVTDMKKDAVPATNINNTQLWSINLSTRKLTQLTYHSSPMSGEVVCEKTKTVFFQIKDSVFALDFVTKKERLVFVYPEDFRSAIMTVNVDGTLRRVPGPPMPKKKF